MAEDRGLSNLISTASSLVNSSQTHSSNAGHGTQGAHKPSSSSTQGTSSSHSHQKPSYGEIFSSAQVVMNAAKTKLHKPSSTSSSPAPEDESMGKLASAAGTLIGAVAHYGKLEESGYGKYAQKAQEYLHSYEIKHGKPGSNATAGSPPQSSAYYATSEQHGHAQGHSTYTSVPASQYSQPSAPSQYPPTAYPSSQESYGYGHQGHSKPANSSTNVGNDPPLAYPYPPPGYPTNSGGSYIRPSK